MITFAPFSLKVAVDESDIFRVAKYLQNRSVLYRYSWFFAPLLLAVTIFMVIQSMSYSTDQTNYLTVAIICLVPAFLLCVGILLSKRRIEPWILKRRFKRLKSIGPGFSEPIYVNITNEYVESATTVSSVKWSWSAFSRLEETDDFFLFWAGGVLLFFLTTRELREGNKENEFRWLMEEKGLLS